MNTTKKEAKGEKMIKEYVLSMDQLIEKYPLGSKHLIGDETYIVREHINNSGLKSEACNSVYRS